MRTALILFFLLQNQAYASDGFSPEPGTCLLRYLNVQDKYYLLAIGEQYERVFDLGNDRHIDSLALCFLQGIQQRKPDPACGHLLYRAILPLSLQYGQRLVICADGRLSLLPFECLLPDSTNASTLLLHLAPIQYTDGLRNWLTPGNASGHTATKRLAIAPDFSCSGKPELPFAFRETGIHDTKTISLRGLSKQTFFRMAPQYDILHLATHTCGKTKNGLLLSPTDTLFAPELSRLNLDTQLLILSACNSAGTFTASFREAGVHNVLASSWDLPDKSSAEIVASFYRYLGQGIDKSRALQLAKIDYLRNTDAEGAKPFYWAGLVLYGDQTEICLQQPKYFLALWLDGSLCLLAAVLFCLGRKYIPKGRRCRG